MTTITPPALLTQSTSRRPQVTRARRLQSRPRRSLREEDDRQEVTRFLSDEVSRLRTPICSFVSPFLFFTSSAPHPRPPFGRVHVDAKWNAPEPGRAHSICVTTCGHLPQLWQRRTNVLRRRPQQPHESRAIGERRPQLSRQQRNSAVVRRASTMLARHVLDRARDPSLLTHGGRADTRQAALDASVPAQ